MLPESSPKRSRFYSAVFFLLVLGLPLATKFYLNAEIGVFPLLLIIFAVAGPVYLHRIKQIESRFIPYLSGAAVSILALGTLVGILITPLSAYTYWFESFTAGSPEGAVGTIFVLLVTLFTVVVTPLSRKFGLLWPLLILAIVVFYLLTIIVQKDFFVLILVMLMIASAVYFMMRRVRSGARLINSLYVTGLIIVTLFTAILVPDLAQGRGNEFVNDTVFPALRQAVVRVFPRFPLLYSVPGYGMSFDESSLGGRPHLLNNPLFEVEGDPGELLYLRTRVFDTYNGTSWSMASGNPRPLRSEGSRFLRVADQPSSDYLRLSVAAKSFFYLPYTLDTKRIHFKDELPGLSSGAREVGFELAGPLKAGTEIYLEKYASGESVPSSLESGERERYMQIPADLPGELRTIAEEIERGTSSKTEILTRIEAFLAYNYTYSIDVDDLALRMGEQQRADFAYSFLFQAETGYCVHFATSFILLARLTGVPARYATGFYTRIPQGQTTTTVTGLSAHAWPEVYLEDRGWVNWEATPAANAANYTITEDQWFFNLGINLDPATTRQLEGLMGSEVTGSVSTSGGEGERSVRVGLVFVVIGSVIVAGALAFWFIRFGYPAVRYFADKRGRMYHSLRRLTRRLERKGVPNPASTGWIAWADSVKNIVSTEPSRDETMSGAGASGASGAAEDEECRQVDTMIGHLLAQTYGGEEWRPEVAEDFEVFRKSVLEGIKRAAKEQTYAPE